MPNKYIQEAMHNNEESTSKHHTMGSPPRTYQDGEHINRPPDRGIHLNLNLNLTLNIYTSSPILPVGDPSAHPCLPATSTYIMHQHNFQYNHAIHFPSKTHNIPQPCQLTHKYMFVMHI